jgi:hypothetical protein
VRPKSLKNLIGNMYIEEIKYIILFRYQEIYKYNKHLFSLLSYIIFFGIGVNKVRFPFFH